ncbi:MAG: hypothetical protein J0M09_08585 [Xanthomonadales bacterium]|nr:hypothetical protein [Xanthomonadales bacterium]
MVAGCALWLLLAGPQELFGWDTGQFGMVLLVASAWGLLYVVSQMSGEELQRSASPAEWKARIGAGFTVIAMVYFFAKMHVLKDVTLPHDPDANAIGRNLVLLLIAWLVLSEVLASRWKGAVEEDERDREIAVLAASWGHRALIFCIVGIAMLSFTPADRLEWATPLMIGNLLIFALMWGWLCEYVATLAYYRRDRQ